MKKLIDSIVSYSEDLNDPVAYAGLSVAWIWLACAVLFL